MALKINYRDLITHAAEQNKKQNDVDTNRSMMKEKIRIH